MTHHHHAAAHTALGPKIAEEFFRGWLNLIDSGAPVESFYKYLVDGECAATRSNG